MQEVRWNIAASNYTVFLLALAFSVLPAVYGLCEAHDAREESFVAGPRDPENPLHVYRLPVTKSVKQLADKLADGSTSDSEKMIRFMRFIRTSKVGRLSKSTPDAMIAEMTGACGDFSNTLAAMATTQGIKARLITLGNWPAGDGHAVMEAYIDGKWRLYDPTYGIYYYLASDPKQSPLSFDEIRHGYSHNNNIQIKTETTENSAIRFAMDLYAGKNIFLNAKPTGVIGPDNPLFYPLALDMSTKSKLEKNEFGPKHQGASFIGAASTNQNQDWTLMNLATGTRYAFTVEPDWLGGDLNENDFTFSLKASLDQGIIHGESGHQFVFVGANKRSDPWKIYFTPSKPDVILRLEHAYRGPDFRYMVMKRYELTKD